MNKFKLYTDLQHWLELGIANDIVNCPDHRPGYANYVAKYKASTRKQIPQLVLEQLERELLKDNEPIWLRIKSCFVR